ncbi:MAG: hypothetical protein LBT30_05990 [Clostridiales bacterium]|jgi:hypothetical protein|nr:hypothetical protein [Clostridiales bacterium]
MTEKKNLILRIGTFAAPIIVAVILSVMFLPIGSWFKAATPKFGENIAKSAAVDAGSDGVKYKAGKNLFTGAPYLSFAATDGSVYIELDFAAERSFDTIVLSEPTDNVGLFRIYKTEGNAEVLIYESDKIGKYCLCYIEYSLSSKIRIEITESNGAVNLKSVEIYTAARRIDSPSPLRVVQYLDFSKTDITVLEGLPTNDFSGYYDVVTDVVITGAVALYYAAPQKGEKNWFNTCTLTFYGEAGGSPGSQRDTAKGNSASEMRFEANLDALKRIIGDRNVRIWVRTDIKQKDFDGIDSNKYTAEFIHRTRSDVDVKLTYLVAYYGVYGMNFYWDTPENAYQWGAYGRFVKECSNQVKVFVTVSACNMKLNKKAIQKAEMIDIIGYDTTDKNGYTGTAYESGAKAIRNAVKSLGIPKEKMILSISSTGTATDGSGTTVDYGSAALGKWSNLLYDYQYADGDGNILKSSVYFSGYAVTRDKTLLAIDTGLCGVSLSDALADAPYSYEYSLHRAIGEVKNYR